MNVLLEQLAEAEALERTKREKAAGNYFTIVRRAGNPKKADAERLRGILRQLDIPMAQLEADLATLERARGLAAYAAQEPDLLAHEQDARTRREQAAAASKAAADAAADAEFELHKVSTRRQDAIRARQELAALRQRHLELLAEPLDNGSADDET